jgi:competence protein ComEA
MLDLSRRERFLVGILLALAILNVSTIYYFSSRQKPDIAFKMQSDVVPVISDSVQTEKEIMVYVTGAVKAPGVYTLQEGQRLKDAIEKAGGFLDDADLLSVNLAKRLNDEDAFYIPKVDEAEADDTKQISGSSGNEVFSKSPFLDDGKVNINKADINELDSLPGIGPATAQKIIDYRAEHGPFKSIDEIKNVSGIGEKKFENIKEKIKVR